MARPMTVSHSVVIAADPATVFASVGDPTQTGRWSPENLGASVRNGASGALPVDTVFVGHNRRRWMRWSTRCRVIAAEPGRTFAFRVEAIGLRTPRLQAPIATWRYDLEAVDGGTRVTETWTDDRTAWSDRRARVFDKLATGGDTFADFNSANIRTTLDRLKQTLEA